MYRDYDTYQARTTRNIHAGRHLLHTGDGQPAGEFARRPARSRCAERFRDDVDPAVLDSARAVRRERSVPRILRGGSAVMVVHGHDEWPPQTRPSSVRIERVDFEDEPIVLLFATRWGSEALEVIFRFEEQDGRIARLCLEALEPRRTGERRGTTALGATGFPIGNQHPGSIRAALRRVRDAVATADGPRARFSRLHATPVLGQRAAGSPRVDARPGWRAGEAIRAPAGRLAGLEGRIPNTSSTAPARRRSQSFAYARPNGSASL